MVAAFQVFGWADRKAITLNLQQELKTDNQ
jgi:hypothetical protein